MSQSLSAASAAELARSTFRRLAMLRLAPTPENYGRIWAELVHAGDTAGGHAPGPQQGPQQGSQPAPAHQAAQVAQVAQAPQGAAAAPLPKAPQAAAWPAPPVAAAPWRQMWEHSLHLGLIPAVADQPALQQRAGQLLARGQTPAPDMLGENRDLWQEFQRMLAREHAAVDGMLDLFAHLVSHLGAVFSGDTAAAAELGSLQQVVRRPLDGARIDLARSVIEPWLRRQAALQRGALEARVTSRDVVGAVMRSLGAFLGHNERFNQALQQDLRRLEVGLDEQQLGELARELLQRGVTLQGHSSELGQQLQRAQQQAEQALQRIRALESELQQASQQLQEDPLTGALNRRGLDVAFARDLLRAQQSARPISVALLDLDHFKKVNDSYGHDFGDEVLRGLVQVARKLVRPGDSIARMGGEEFMVLFPDADAEAASRVVERLLVGFRNRRLLHRSTGQRVELSFSAGVAQCDAGEDFGALYQRADAALRQAKQEGRQRIRVAAA